MVRRILALTLFLVIALGVGISQKAVSKRADKTTIAIENVKQLMLMMEPRNGKISKEEWIKFMEAEFDKVDTERKGELDQMEIRQSTYVKQARFSDLGR